jgi:hypothetical protein
MKKKYLVIDTGTFEVLYKFKVVEIRKEKRTHYELYSLSDELIISMVCTGDGLIIPKRGGLHNYSSSLEYALCLAFSLNVNSVGNYQLWERV